MTINVPTTCLIILCQQFWGKYLSKSYKYSFLTSVSVTRLLRIDRLMFECKNMINKNSPKFLPETNTLSYFCPTVTEVTNGGIHLGMNYSVLNKMKWNKLWPKTKNFILVNYLFNAENILSKIVQIVTDFSTNKWIVYCSHTQIL
jgi:hypothetical protein